MESANKINTMAASAVSEGEFKKVANKVSFITIVQNVLLSVFKLFAGIFAHSNAMISDAVHSASDVFSTIIVIIGVKLASKESDKEHPYGHERLECVAAIVLSIVLLYTGIKIGSQAVKDIIGGNYQSLQKPGMLALVAAVVSIVTKEIMYWYTRHYAKKIDSSALMADAWHHRSDALSSVGALVGIGGAMMGFPVMDSIASIVIFVFIAKAAYDIFKDAMDKMVDHSCDEETEKEMRDFVLAQKEVLSVDLLHTRIFGNKIYVDVEIGVNGSYTLRHAHEIAEEVHEGIEKNFPKVKHVMVHVNPADVAEFEVPKWLDDMVNEYIVPEKNYRTNPLNQGRCAPKLNDPTTPGRCIEFPAPWIEWIEEYATNGRIIAGGG